MQPDLLRLLIPKVHVRHIVNHSLTFQHAFGISITSDGKREEKNHHRSEFEVKEQNQMKIESFSLLFGLIRTHVEEASERQRKMVSGEAFIEAPQSNMIVFLLALRTISTQLPDTYGRNRFARIVDDAAKRRSSLPRHTRNVFILCLSFVQ